MANFPGIAMIIDDQFDLVYKKNSTKANIAVQQKPLKALKLFFETNYIPFVSITNTTFSSDVIKTVNNYDNVRLLVLDLDLNNDGEVDENEDIPLILNILKNAIKRYGYFFLLINSAHSDAWEEIKPKLENESAVFNKKHSSFKVFDKTQNNLTQIIQELRDCNFSLDLVYDFECFLNRARDEAFEGLIDFEKRTWNKIYKTLVAETSTQSSFVLSTIFLSIIKQHLLNSNYNNSHLDTPIDNDLAIKAYCCVNYINNFNGNLDKHPIWTGNVYYKKNSSHVEYAIVVTPECDLAQNKFINYQVLFGYEINENTFPSNYNPSDYELENIAPIHAMRVGKSKNKWRNKENLKESRGFIEHLYTLPFSSKDGKTIILDYRDLTFISKEDLSSWKLIKRINDPMITDILDKLSLIFNRKGLLPILPDSIKPI